MNLTKLHSRIVLRIAFQLYSMNCILFSIRDSNIINKTTINIYYTNLGILFRLIPIIYFLFYKSLKLDIEYCIIFSLILVICLIYNSYYYFQRMNFQRFLKFYFKINNLKLLNVFVIDLFLTFVLWICALAFYLNFVL